MYIYIDSSNNIEAIAREQLPPRYGFTEIEAPDKMFPLGAQSYLIYEGGVLSKKTHTEAEALSLVQEKQRRISYAVSRANEYPSIGDQLDALWKGGDAAAEMLVKVQAVKAKYPKPTE